MTKPNIFQTSCLFALLMIIIMPAQLLALQPTSSVSFESSSVFFSPKGGIRDKIIAKINLSQKSIKIAIYSFTSGDIAWALENAKKRGVDIVIIADKSQSSGKNSEIPYLISKGFDLKILQSKGRGLMHNKFAVFDDTEVVTGSYNWTDNAEFNNYENAIFINDSEVVKSYLVEFNKLWQEVSK